MANYKIINDITIKRKKLLSTITHFIYLASKILSLLLFKFFYLSKEGVCADGDSPKLMLSVF